MIKKIKRYDYATLAKSFKALGFFASRNRKNFTDAEKQRLRRLYKKVGYSIDSDTHTWVNAPNWLKRFRESGTRIVGKKVLIVHYAGDKISFNNSTGIITATGENRTTKVDLKSGRGLRSGEYYGYMINGSIRFRYRFVKGDREVALNVLLASSEFFENNTAQQHAGYLVIYKTLGEQRYEQKNSNARKAQVRKQRRDKFGRFRL